MKKEDLLAWLLTSVISWVDFDLLISCLDLDLWLYWLFMDFSDLNSQLFLNLMENPQLKFYVF